MSQRFVSPHDNRTTRFLATIKRDVIIDFSGEEPAIVEEKKDEFKLTMPLVPVDAEGNPVEGVVINKFNELVEADVCAESGWVVPLEDLNEQGVSMSYIATKVPAELLSMSHEELIALVMQMQQGGAEVAPKAKAEVAEPAQEETAEEASDEPKKRVRKSRAKKQEATEAPENEGPAAEDEGDEEGPDVKEEKDPLDDVEPIPATQDDEEVDVAF